MINLFFLIFSGFILISCQNDGFSEEQAVAKGDTKTPPSTQNVASPSAEINTDDVNDKEDEDSCKGMIADVIANCEHTVPEWLQSADTELALVHITDEGQIIWEQGVWKEGDWQGGIWKQVIYRFKYQSFYFLSKKMNF